VAENDDPPPTSVVQLIAQIITAHVSQTRSPHRAGSAHRCLAGGVNKFGAEPEPPAEENPEPAVPVRRSFRPDHPVCLVCGKPQSATSAPRTVSPRHSTMSASFSSPTTGGGAELHREAARVRPSNRPGAARETRTPTAEEADDRILASRGRAVIAQGHRAPTRTNCVGRPRLWIWIPAAFSAP
jgi:hypothetical protein